MGMKHKWIVIVLVLVVLAIGGWITFRSQYLMIEGALYHKSSELVVLTGEELPDDPHFWELADFQVLDVRKMKLDASDYEALHAAMPDTTILWNVPFGDRSHHNTSSEITVSSLENSDFHSLQYFSGLQKIDAIACEEYDLLLQLAELAPEVDVVYTVDVGSLHLRENTTEVQVGTEDATALLEAIPYLPQLKVIDATECMDYETIMEIQNRYPELDVSYFVKIRDQSFPGNAEKIVLENVDPIELDQVLKYFPKLTEVKLDFEVVDYDWIYNLMSRWPHIVFDWELSVCGVKTRSTEKELILSNIRMKNTDEIENALKYFYCLERVEMCECGISSEEMDALGKRHPETRFVWTIRIGWSKIRTDITAFIPFKIGFWSDRPFYDDQAKELKYCTDLECLDLGHMRMRDISFLQYMPKLKYLIIADTVAEDYSVIGELTELVYLEIFLTPVKDASFLLNLKNLQNLNISWTRYLENPEVLMEMTWLKRLWATKINLTEEQNEQLKAALPDAVVYTSSKHPTEGGWRQSELYYEMRDLLGMHYME